MFIFPGRNNAARARAKPQLVVNEQGASKKKELDEVAAQTLRRVIDNVDNQLELDKLDSFQKKQFNEQIYDTLVSLLEEENRYLSQGDKQKVIQYVSDEIFGYGPITSLLQDPSVTEIMVNGYANVYIEREGKISKTKITFRDNNHVLHAINKIITPLGRRIDESSPTVDARLPDGSRVNAIIPPLALRGPSLTIRKFSVDPFTAADLIDFGTMSEEMALFLAACVRSRVNIVVSGGTGSGKTTTLNVLSSFIPDNERIVTIEDTAELQLQQDHLVTLESRPANIEGKGQFTIRELVINSLRMRPDRIIVGEVRGGEAFDMLQAMNTGHDGSISTLHANNPRDALARLETMVLMAGMELPLRAIREQIGSAIELVVQQSRFSDGSRKITKISEVVGLKKERLVLRDIFVFQQASIDEEGRVAGEHRTTGVVPRCLEKLKARGESIATDGTIDWGRPGDSLSTAERDLEEQPWEEETEEAGLDLELMESDDVAEQDEQENSAGYLEYLEEDFEDDPDDLDNEPEAAAKPQEGFRSRAELNPDIPEVSEEPQELPLDSEDSKDLADEEEYVAGESFEENCAEPQSRDSQDPTDDAEHDADPQLPEDHDAEDHQAQENEAKEGGEKEEKSPAVLLTAHSLVIKAAAAPPERTVTAAELPERRIGFLAEIPNNNYYGPRSPIFGAGESLQPAANLIKGAAVTDTVGLADVNYVTADAAMKVTNTANMTDIVGVREITNTVDLEEVTDVVDVEEAAEPVEVNGGADERFFPYRAASGQVCTTVEMADDEQVSVEEREHWPLGVADEEWESEPAAGEERESLLPVSEENQTGMMVQESASEPAAGEEGESMLQAGEENQSGTIIREREGEPAVTGEEKIAPAVSAAEEKNTFSAAPAEVTAGEGTGQRSLAASIPPGRRGIALRVNESGGLCSYLHPGDRVDVLVIYHDQSAHEQQAARTVAQSAIVLDIRENSVKSIKERDAALFSVILAVTPAQAELLAYACFQGVFYLTLCPTGEPVLPK